MEKETVSTKKSEKQVETAERDALAAREQSRFLGAVLTMSWQLAVVVLLPVIGGHYLDNHLHASPLWTIIGFVVAIGAASIIVWRQAQAVSPHITTSNEHKEQPR